MELLYTFWVEGAIITGCLYGFLLIGGPGRRPFIGIVEWYLFSAVCYIVWPSFLLGLIMWFTFGCIEAAYRIAKGK